MIPKSIQWIVFICFLLILSGKYLYDGITSIELSDRSGVISKKQEFVKGKCTEKEQIDRWLLQQSWFYDPEFKKLAGAFGQNNFSLYEKDDNLKKRKEGAFCISGKKLFVTYYQTKYVPRKISFKNDSVFSINMGIKLKKLNDEIINVIKIDEKKIKLFFQNENKEYIFYRKN